MAKKKKKTGSIAVPFLITIFVGLLVIGGGAYAIYKYFGFNQSPNLEEPTPRAVQTISAEDNHTVLMILDEPDLKCSSTFVIMRSKPKEKKLVFIGIPTNTICVINGQQQRIDDVYERNGSAGAVDFTQQLFGIEIDRYIQFNSASFRKLCDILGGVTYTVEPDIAGFKSDGSPQFLNSTQIETLVTYPLFSEKEIQRAYIASSIAADMVNQTDGKRISDNFKNSFDTIINMVSTDITSVDYKNRQYAIRTMLENGTSIASFLRMNGETANDDFIPSEADINDFRTNYFSD